METRYLEQLGFPIPEHARNMALQEEKLLSYQDGLKHILQRYRSCIEALQPAEVSFPTILTHALMCIHMHEHRICVCTYSSAGTNAQNHTNAYVRTEIRTHARVCALHRPLLHT